MKKFTFIFLAVFFTVCLSTQAQVVADIGTDWDGTKSVPAVSGMVYVSDIDGVPPVPAGPNDSTKIIYEGTENEVKFNLSSIGTIEYRNGSSRTDNLTYLPLDVHGAVQEPFAYWELRSALKAYFELSVTDKSNGKCITKLAINGASGSGEVDTGGNPVAAPEVAILYSDKYPFDEKSIIGYDVLPLPYAKYGVPAVSSIPPTGCKSVRIYNEVMIELGNDLIHYAITEDWGDIYGNAKRIRTTYLAVTLEDDNGSGIGSANADGKVITSEEYYDVTGKRVDENTKGLVIVKSIFDDGTSSVKKVVNNK